MFAPDILKRYNAPGIAIANADSPKNIKVAADVINQLQSKYPGWNWGVDANVRAGLIDIKCLDLDGMFAYTIKLTGLISWASLRDKITIAGGEILERYQMPRSRMDLDTWREIPRNIKGLPGGDYS